MFTPEFFLHPVFMIAAGLIPGLIIGLIIHSIRLKQILADKNQYFQLQQEALMQTLNAAKEQAVEYKNQLMGASQKAVDYERQLKEESNLRYLYEERARQASGQLAHLEGKHTQQQQDLHQVTQKHTQLQTELEKEREHIAQKLASFKQMEEQFKETFKSLSLSALDANNQSFLNLAKNTLNQIQEKAQVDLTTRQTSIQAMLTPVKEALTKVDDKLSVLENARVGAYEVLKQQVNDMKSTHEMLQKETGNLVRALKAPNVRGQWGEMQLKRVVEMAGMLERCDFSQQVHVNSEDGILRPDMVVHLPGGKKIIVDAKAPLSAYLEALEEVDETVRQDRLKDHARQVRDHIKVLSQRSYWDQFEDSPEFVIMFLPGETFFSAALEKDPSLIEVGVQQRVILATPTTLIALLRAVAYGWHNQAIAENAKEISTIGKELYKRIRDMNEHLTRLGRAINQATDTYNKTIGSFETRVLVSARKLQALDHSDGKGEIEDIAPLTSIPRTLQAS